MTATSGYPKHITRRQVEALAWAVRQAHFLRGACIPPHDIEIGPGDDPYRALREHDALVKEARKALALIRCGLRYQRRGQ